jgi:hypothetical protein
MRRIISEKASNVGQRVMPPKKHVVPENMSNDQFSQPALIQNAVDPVSLFLQNARASESGEKG